MHPGIVQGRFQAIIVRSADVGMLIDHLAAQPLPLIHSHESSLPMRRLQSLLRNDRRDSRDQRRSPGA